MSRDYRQNPETHIHRRCDWCSTDYVIAPEELEQWEAEHSHEGEK